MATVATVIAMAPTYVPYERPPDPATLWSAVPRGLRGFQVATGIVEAKPINDDQTLQLTGTLPANFAYVFAEIAFKLDQDQANFWTPKYTLNLQNYYQGSTALSMTWIFSLITHPLGAQIASGGVEAPLLTVGLPKAPMWAPKGSSGILISMQARNGTATAALSGTVDAYINFWEFDLEQIRKYPINAPIPVHSR